MYVRLINCIYCNKSPAITIKETHEKQFWPRFCFKYTTLGQYISHSHLSCENYYFLHIILYYLIHGQKCYPGSRKSFSSKKINKSLLATEAYFMKSYFSFALSSLDRIRFQKEHMSKLCQCDFTQKVLILLHGRQKRVDSSLINGLLLFNDWLYLIGIISLKKKC